MQRREGFIVRIKIKDEHGHVIDETEAIAFKGLLALAHEDGLRSIGTRIVQLPLEENHRTAVVTARVRTSKGVFTGTGDANPTNVNRRIVPHLLRMAETRAIARAFRLAVNIGVVAIEELAEEVAIVGGASELHEPSGRSAPRTFRRSEGAPSDAREAADDRGNGGGQGLPERARGRDDQPTDAAPGDRRAMSSEQRKLLFRLAFDLGETQDTAPERVRRALGVERLEWATRADASKAIDALKRELNSRGPVHGLNGGVAHGGG